MLRGECAALGHGLGRTHQRRLRREVHGRTDEPTRRASSRASYSISARAPRSACGLDDRDHAIPWRREQLACAAGPGRRGADRRGRVRLYSMASHRLQVQRGHRSTRCCPNLSKIAACTKRPVEAGVEHPHQPQRGLAATTTSSSSMSSTAAAHVADARLRQHLTTSRSSSERATRSGVRRHVGDRHGPRTSSVAQLPGERSLSDVTARPSTTSRSPAPSVSDVTRIRSGTDTRVRRPPADGHRGAVRTADRGTRPRPTDARAAQPVAADAGSTAAGFTIALVARSARRPAGRYKPLLVRRHEPSLRLPARRPTTSCRITVVRAGPGPGGMGSARVRSLSIRAGWTEWARSCSPLATTTCPRAAAAPLWTLPGRSEREGDYRADRVARTCGHYQALRCET